MTENNAQKNSNVVIAQSELNIFEQIRQVDSQNAEFWAGRDLESALGYKSWRPLEKLILSVKEELEFEGKLNHIGLFSKTTQTGKGRLQEITDYKLSRLACYKIAMRGETDACKLSRTYFATQTRKQEIQEQNQLVQVQTPNQNNSLDFLQGMLNEMKNQSSKINALAEKTEAVADTQASLIGRITTLEAKPAPATEVTVKTAKEYLTVTKEKTMAELRRPISDLVKKFFGVPREKLENMTKKQTEEAFMQMWHKAKEAFKQSSGGFNMPSVSCANKEQLKKFLSFLENYSPKQSF